MEPKEEQIERAKLAEQAERYDDMVTAMKAVVTITNGDLKDDERNFLSVAYKNVVGARRSAWRILKSLEEKEERAKEEKKRDLAREQRKKIEKELNEKCHEVLNLIDKHLYPNAEALNACEAKVFYLKMKGDYYRYLVEIHHNEESGEKSEEFKKLATDSKDAYDKAKKECESLPATHPIKLGLALNFSVFYYEIEENPEKACKLAEEAYEDAMVDLENAEETATFKDSTLIMQLLRDNLTLWKQEAQDRDADEDQGD